MCNLNLKIMNRTTKRNVLGIIGTILMCMILNGLGVAFMMLREVYQSKKYGFLIETDDIIRYSISGSVGCILNFILIVLVTKLFS